MSRPDELEVPVRLGDSPPLLPFRKPFDLTAWQLALLLVAVGSMLNLERAVPLSDEPFQDGAPLSAMFSARVVVLALGLVLVFVRPGDRMLISWIGAQLGHFWRCLPAVFMATDDQRGPIYFDADAEAMTAMKLEGSSSVFVVDPPLWSVFKYLPAGMRGNYWRRHVPYRLVLPVEAQGSLELMTDVERAARWHALWAGLRALQHPIQIVAQTRAEDAAWLAERAAPPPHSPLAQLREPTLRWAHDRAQGLMYRRIVVTAAAPDMGSLTEHVRDVTTALREAGLGVRQVSADEQREIFDRVYGSRRFYPHPVDSFGIDGIDWVTIAVLRFPRHCVVGWLNFVIGSLPVDAALYAEPDDAAWIQRSMEWFQGAADLETADTAHHDAARDLTRVEGKLKREEDCVLRTTLLLTMPKAYVPRIANRLRKSGATFRLTRWEHQLGRMATLPIGGAPRVGVTRPYDGASVAGTYPFGSSGLRMPEGMLLGVAREAPEAITLDLRDVALNAAMVVILGTTGAGKTFLMQLMLLRSGLPFVVIDMKPHLDETRHGDFWPLIAAAGGGYHVARAGEPVPMPHPFAQCYNLARVADADKPEVLQAIAELEWQRAVDSLEDRIFAVDEAYWLGRTPAGQELIERIVSQGRSVGFIGICASQEVGDFLGERRLAKAVTMSSVQFVLAQDHSAIDTVVQALKLGGEASGELRKFQPQPGDVEASLTRSAIMRVGQRVCSMRIEASPTERALFTTKPSEKRARRKEALGHEPGMDAVAAGRSAGDRLLPLSGGHTARNGWVPAGSGQHRG